MADEQRRVFVVEVEKLSPVPPMTDEIREGLQALKQHPAMRYLLSKARLQKAALRKELEGSQHQSLKAVYWLQQGIYWSDWLDREFADPRAAVPPQARELGGEDKKVFDEIRASLNIVSV